MKFSPFRLTWPETRNCRQLVREWQRQHRQQLAEWELVDDFRGKTDKQTAKRGTHGKVSGDMEKQLEKVLNVLAPVKNSQQKLNTN